MDNVTSMGAFDLRDHLELLISTTKKLEVNETQSPGATSCNYAEQLPQQSSYSSPLESDLLSIPDSADGPESLNDSDPMKPVLDAVALQLVSQYKSAVYGDIPLGERLCSTTESGPKRPETVNRSSRKRRRSDEEDEDAGSDRDYGPVTSPKRSKKGPKRLLLACPFWKLDSIKHRRCFSHDAFARIRDVKQHLKRKHTPEFYCPRCKTTFGTALALTEHVSQKNWVCSVSETLDGISTQQSSQLSRKSKAGISEEKQWFAVWDIVFVGRPRPGSAYIDADFSEEVNSLREYCKSNAGPAIAEAKRTAQISDEFATEDIDAYMERTFLRAFDILHDDWHMNRSAALGHATVSSSSSRSNLQPTTGASTGSLADSGVALGTQESTTVSEFGTLPYPMPVVGYPMPSVPEHQHRTAETICPELYDFNFDILPDASAEEIARMF
ncbi:Het and ankyrin domain protein [Colletotrichum higginsianum IMI 349063]|uniref:Het and ankyrin domain protein n=2 Tax=Colletotrichum higginsianum (strain IMI 349063) TaxID=759273 RepID=A0A1B7YEM6_COLHI|nr:Het and ankyrin domain protein [Colletotrichum higginsianum IMI 349063]OBR10492.1 Het and ankyrin domain protein [Colletotrichum higginsianum IMI 349063]GJD02490.1 HET and ankyrin domain protein [Colletotrichum higginsianum]